MFLAFPKPQNILGTIILFLRLQLTLPSPQCMSHALAKLCRASFRRGGGGGAPPPPLEIVKCCNKIRP